MIAKQVKPFRFFGPVDDKDASEIAEKMLDSESFRDTLVRFLAGDIDPQEFVYEVQVVAETAEEETQAFIDEEDEHARYPGAAS
jgi:hypothetical protein